MTDATMRAVDEVVRTSYGRLLACLAAEHRDLVGAEDALADAIERAVRTWPETGEPDRPEAWLLTVARRRMIDGHRRREVAEQAEPDLRLLVDERAVQETGPIPGKRLELLFVCAHPAIDASVRSPLMLQTVLGVDAARIYAAFGTGWEGDPSSPDHGLAEEAIRLTALVRQLLPEHPSVHGLEALMLYSHARREARRAPDGAFVPLADQDTGRWDHAMVDDADAAIARAAEAGPAHHYVIEAMIQGTHAWRARTGTTDWRAVVALYDALLRVAPGVGAAVARAAALLEADGPEAAIAALDRIDHPRIRDYQPWWTVRAHALLRAGDDAAADTVRHAAGLTDDDAVRRYLLALLD